MRRPKRHQKLAPVHGDTKFSDMTSAEVRKHLGLRSRLRIPADAGKPPVLPRTDLPADFNRRNHGAVTDVKNQGSCGSSEGPNSLATGKRESLNEQQLVDCDNECDPEEQGSCDSGCNGGLKAGGLMISEEMNTFQFIFGDDEEEFYSIHLPFFIDAAMLLSGQTDVDAPPVVAIVDQVVNICKNATSDYFETRKKLFAEFLDMKKEVLELKHFKFYCKPHDHLTGPHQWILKKKREIKERYNFEF